MWKTNLTVKELREKGIIDIKCEKCGSDWYCKLKQEGKSEECKPVLYVKYIGREHTDTIVEVDSEKREKTIEEIFKIKR